jgi:anti-sigma factor ChrR (cupin superfamily)
MSDRKITDPFNVNFKPFDLYGKTIPGMSWHKVSYNAKNGYGSYILKMNPGAKSLSHKHINYEEFLILDGELIDVDNKIFKKNDLVTFDPETTHSSFTKIGCLILVFMRGINEPI